MRPSCLLEVGDDLAQFGVYSATVVTFVVVFCDDLPVCRHFVGNHVARPQLMQRIANRTLYGGPQLRAHAACGRLMLRIQLEEKESAPAIQGDRMQGKILWPEGFRAP